MALEPQTPFLLFSLAGFTTTSTDEVLDIVRQHWYNPATQLFLAEAVESFRYDDPPLTTDQVGGFVNSLEIERIETKGQGGIPLPRFNILANGALLPNDEYWHIIREYLRSVKYTSNMGGTGTPQEPISCTLCHGVDHPRGLCPLPDLPGWNGPGHIAPTPTQYLGRGRGGMRGGRGAFSRGRGAAF